MTDTALGTSAALAATETLESPARRAWRRLVRHKGAMLGLVTADDLLVLYLFWEANRPELVPTMVGKASKALTDQGFRVSVVEQKAPPVVGLIGRR